MVRFLLAAGVAILAYFVGVIALPLGVLLAVDQSGLADGQFLDVFGERVFDGGVTFQCLAILPAVISAFRKDPRPVIRAARCLGAAIVAGLCWYILFGLYWLLFWDPAATDPTARAVSQVGPGVFEVLIITGISVLISQWLLPKRAPVAPEATPSAAEPSAPMAPIVNENRAPEAVTADERLKEHLRKLAHLRDEGLIDAKTYDARVEKLLDAV